MSPTRPGLAALARYFLYLGSLGFGGPVALVGAMQRDLVERRRWLTPVAFKKGLALSQLAPGPLAAQLAMCLGYECAGAVGATVAGLAFVVPSYLMTVAIGVVYVRYGGLAWMPAAFYGVGAAVIAIVGRAAWKLARLTVGRDVLLGAILVVLAAVTAWAEAELVSLFVLSGALVLLVKAPPSRLRRLISNRAGLWALVPGLLALPAGPGGTGTSAGGILAQLFWFFVEAGAFVFGSGLAIVPFLYGGVVQGHGWLDDRQFLDAVAVAMLTPGPVVITVAFIGYLVAGQAGAAAAAAGVFLPVYLFVVVPYRWFDRISENPQVRAFVDGVTAAATGAIAGAAVVLARRAIVDLPTAAIALVTLLVLSRLKVPEPLLILGGGLAGLALRGLAA